MRIGIIGLGNQGKKRLKAHTNIIEWTVDPFNSDADFKEYSPDLGNRVDAIFLCVPDSFKRQYIFELTKSGKNILVEKPVILQEKDYEKIESNLALNKSVFYEAFNHRYYRNILKIKELISGNELGKIYTCSYTYGNGTSSNIKLDRNRDMKYGVLSDLGSHLLDLHLFFFGNFEGTVQNVVLKKFENDSFDYVSFDLVGTSNFRFEVSYLNWKNKFSIEVYGSKGFVKLSGLGKWEDSMLEVYERPLNPRFPTLTFRGQETSDPTWQYENLHFQGLIQNNSSGNFKNTKEINTFYKRIVECAEQKIKS